MRYHLTLVKMATVKKSTNNKFWREWGEKRTLLHCWWECKLYCQYGDKFLKKLRLKLPYDPIIPLLGMYSEKTIMQKNTCAPAFKASPGHGSNLDDN